MISYSSFLVFCMSLCAFYLCFSFGVSFSSLYTILYLNLFLLTSFILSCEESLSSEVVQ